MTKLSWTATGFACLAAIVQSFAPMWLFIAFILISITLTGIGFIIMQRRFRHQLLVDKMDKAFGKPKPHTWDEEHLKRLRGGFKPGAHF